MSDDKAEIEADCDELLAQIGHLEADRDAWKQQCKDFDTANEKWYQRLKAAEAECDRLRAVAEQLAAALNGVKHRNSEPGRLCWCDTIAGWYCCGQPQCNAASAAVAAYTALKVVAS